MSNTNCCCRRDCTAIAVVASIIIAIIAAALSFMGTVTITAVFHWVTLGVAVVSLGVALFAVLLASTYSRSCICSALDSLFVGILGTVLLSLVLLGTAIVATTPIGAIVNGLLIGFFALILTSFACLARCVANCSSCGV